jgi:TatD DNase family protein
MFIDTHCHLSIKDYDDIEKIISDDFEKVDKIIISGCDKESIFESIEIANKYENIFVTIGYHPDQVDVVTEADLDTLENLFSNKKVIGIGEIGLDYHYDDTKKSEQIELFEKQLDLALKHNLPVVIHSRDATMDTINTLKKYKVKGIIHAFSGSVETAEIYIKMGFLLGIGGVVTFKNSKLYEVVEKIGVDNLVLETDSPYLTPHPYRGKQNSSKYIPIIAEKISDITGLSIEKVGEITSSNAYRLFDLNNKK